MFACIKHGYHCSGDVWSFMFTFVLCCLTLCYHVLPVSIPFICLCLLVVHVDVGDGLRCMTIVCSEYRRYACFFASSWLNTCMVVLSLCYCMVVILMLVSCYAMSSVVLVIFMHRHYTMLSWIWFIVDMVHSYVAPRAYVDIMFMHYRIMLFYHGSAYCIQD